jgi:hypothetical protein
MLFLTFRDTVIIGGACNSSMLHSWESNGIKDRLYQRKNNITVCYMTD